MVWLVLADHTQLRYLRYIKFAQQSRSSGSTEAGASSLPATSSQQHVDDVNAPAMHELFCYKPSAQWLKTLVHQAMDSGLMNVTDNQHPSAEDTTGQQSGTAKKAKRAAESDVDQAIQVMLGQFMHVVLLPLCCLNA